MYTSVPCTFCNDKLKSCKIAFLGIFIEIYSYIFELNKYVCRCTKFSVIGACRKLGEHFSAYKILPYKQFLCFNRKRAMDFIEELHA